MTSLSFNNTEIAFAHKSNRELKEAYWLFKLMSKPLLVKLGTQLTPWAINKGLPVNGLIKRTIYKQFVGGETLEQTAVVADKLATSNVQAILDYGIEGKEGEAEFDYAKDQFIKVIQYASSQSNIPYMSIKVTGFARFALLEKLDSLMNASAEESLVRRYNAALKQLKLEELQEWNRVCDRVKQIAVAANDLKVGVFVDAEESWIQEPIDAVTMLLMDEFNRGKLVIFNTIQLYRHDRLEFLKKSLKAAQQRNFLLGAKLVRGAYMEKERKRAIEKDYPSPIQPDKESSDRDYNDGVRLCIDNIDQVGLIVASHNEYSNLLATQLLIDKGLPLNHKHVHFSQLYGMSDNITYNLAKAGCSVSKYLPFGPIKEVIPYLMRRAQENTSVGGQTTRELSLLKKEIIRRQIKKHSA